MDPSPDPKKTEAKTDYLKQRRDTLLYVLIGIGVGLSIGLFLYGIKMTHHVAGPLFKVSLYLEKLKNGKYGKVYGLRKGDQLVGFFDQFKEAHETLRRRQELDVERLKDIVAAAEKAELGKGSPEVAAGLEELRTLLKTKEASLV